MCSYERSKKQLYLTALQGHNSTVYAVHISLTHRQVLLYLKQREKTGKLINCMIIGYRTHTHTQHSFSYTILKLIFIYSIYTYFHIQHIFSYTTHIFIHNTYMIEYTAYIHIFIQNLYKSIHLFIHNTNAVHIQRKHIFIHNPYIFSYTNHTNHTYFHTQPKHIFIHNTLTHIQPTLIHIFIHNTYILPYTLITHTFIHDTHIFIHNTRFHTQYFLGTFSHTGLTATHKQQN